MSGKFAPKVAPHSLFAQTFPLEELQRSGEPKTPTDPGCKRCRGWLFGERLHLDDDDDDDDRDGTVAVVAIG